VEVIKYLDGNVKIIKFYAQLETVNSKFWPSILYIHTYIITNSFQYKSCKEEGEEKEKRNLSTIFYEHVEIFFSLLLFSFWSKCMEKEKAVKSKIVKSLTTTNMTIYIDEEQEEEKKNSEESLPKSTTAILKSQWS